MLMQKKQFLWNEPVQMIVKQNIANVVPSFPEWADETHGQEYLQALHATLQTYPEALEKFETALPYFEGQQPDDITMDALVGHAGAVHDLAQTRRKIVGDT